tara:strand:- start:324 stop:482 length:159 start_codon:yes stop_codon:yes gene_type:complete
MVSDGHGGLGDMIFILYKYQTNIARVIAKKAITTLALKDINSPSWFLEPVGD